MLEIHLIIVIVCISKAVCVDVDYYVEEDQANTSLKTEARRNVGDFIKLARQSSQTYGHDEDIMKHYYYRTRAQHKFKEAPVLLNTSEAVEGRAYSLIANTNYINTSFDKVNYSFGQHLFKDYHYNYDDDVDTESTESHEFSDTLYYNMIYIGRNDENKMTYFYNLDPAVDDLIELDMQVNSSDRVWYSTQGLPCWELPVVYGELERKNRKPEVFAMYNDKLKNIIEAKKKKQSVYLDEIKMSMKYSANKWCEIQPCYGDHTLCLFENDIYPKICGKHYLVKEPNILDQRVIVNIINSMRNRIANGLSKRYKHLATAANMKQVLYDYDLQKMASTWLRQCIPGPAPCSALDGSIVSELECTKFAKHCCFNVHKYSYWLVIAHITVVTILYQISFQSKRLRRSDKIFKKSFIYSKPKIECYIIAIVGCIHVWFWKAGKNLIKNDVDCGRATVSTYPTVQLLWAETAKVGCAYAQKRDGDVRVVCNFSPGAPFFIHSRLYCGIVSFRKDTFDVNQINLTKEEFIKKLGLQWKYNIHSAHNHHQAGYDHFAQHNAKDVGKDADLRINNLNKIYEEGWAREQFGDWRNGTKSWIAVLVSKYTFIDKSESRCDSNEPIYIVGKPGELCTGRGQTYSGLCDDFSDPTRFYRVIALIAPIVLFTLVLYDLFSGIVGQNNYY